MLNATAYLYKCMRHGKNNPTDLTHATRNQQKS